MARETIKKMNSQELIKEIEHYKLKSKDKENWVLNSGDIVINKSQWRTIKLRYLSTQKDKGER